MTAPSSPPASAVPARPRIDWIRVIAYTFPLVFALCLLVRLASIRSPYEDVKRAQARGFTFQLASALKHYSDKFTTMPAGDATRILGALHGENPGKIDFFQPTGFYLSPLGELIDPWGTPYRIDVTDLAHPRVYSCGRDRLDNGGTPGSDDIASAQ